MILNWEQGQDNNWQAVLWRELSNEKTAHFAALKQLFLEKLSLGQVSASLFPERVMIFGISVLPPSYVEILEAVSSLIEVHFFLLNPSAEYWDDILSPREISQHIKNISKKNRKKTVNSELLHIDQGNPLLASLGKAGRDFIVKLHNTTDEISFAAEPDETNSPTLLQSIQSDIFHLRNRTDHLSPPCKIAQSDKSIQVHSCHSPMREVEILYDNLLSMFENDSTLTPSDIVVMTPNIDLYAPFIKAVFNACEEARMKIPFSIADRSFRSESSMTEHFLAMLELPESRFTIKSILDLLESPQIRSSFDIRTQDLSKIRNWLINSNIRWGIDETALKSLGLPEFTSNTWDAGISRLLLGYALPSNKEKLFKGIAGFDDIEGSDSEIFGNFLNFYTALVNFRKLLQKNYSVSEWAELLSSGISRFFKALPENEHEIIALRNCLYDLGKSAAEADFTDQVDIGLFRTAFSENISGINHSPGFITGGVTFCAMLPMRSIPFRVICLIGFNEDTFPRKSVYHSWDLIAQNPKPGDRSLQFEDRYLFLETILSARDIWYVSYVGSSNNGANSRKPSVMVDEVLDYIRS
ncbi:MAG: exodeoxyribonuclease V subunit gamma, partial [Fibrobacter sp.]|nr:exodeoxyribonuclease V subunit gamma [Fibrobacter sp.]